MEYVPLPCTAMNITCFSSEANRNAAYAQIQSDIATLEKAILAIKTRHNALNITARLPDELLAKIFTCDVFESRTLQVSRTRMAGVCTAWRRVALNCPYLWNCVRFSSINWITKMVLPRSAQVSLDIYLPDERSPEGLNMILGEIHRIQHLGFYMRYERRGEAKQAMLTNLIKPAPMMESCTMRASTPFKLPDNLFGNHSPKLRMLRLSNFTIPAILPLMSRLTVFELDTKSSGGVSLSYLMTLLAGAPYLTTVTLLSACSLVDTTMVHAHLPHLQYLTIVDNIGTVTSIISCIVHPATIYLDVDANVSNQEDAVASQTLAQELGTHIADVVGLRITCNSPYVYTTAEIHYEADSQANKPQVKVSFSKTQDIVAFVETLCLHHLQVLTLQDGPSAWGVLNTNTPCLNVIRVRSVHCLQAFLKALLDGVSKDEVRNVHRLHEGVIGSQIGELTNSNMLYHESQQKKYLAFMLESASLAPGPLRFPSLKNVILEMWDDQRQETPVDPFMYDCAILASILRLRSDRGLPLEKLRVEHYYSAGDEYLTIIRDVVKSIYWNGVAPDTTRTRTRNNKDN
ncbi:hypothetical protein H2248_002321 [Termitomyces sp. 'cryptogamus']|nr:hypothetical protein H2248_002321 [Termitomyces sp. 'cryptogamus']